ncbi:MAG: RagB/SusD family nutrient uptake outer membrane protein [Bacteroidaceae bacterium]|nr:RagB/SusD family nutrient uptake outer membrane protein [Bacteroidaceae bacterium]
MKSFLNKYIFGSLLFGAISMTFSSCSLDEYNPSGEGADEVFVTAQGMEGLVNQMYYNFRWKYYGREDPVLYMEGSADIWQNLASSYEYGMQLTRCVNLQGDRGQMANVWNRVYDNINDCNAIINRINDAGGMTADVRETFEGEARFMRSYCYWWLVEFFGDIELRTQETGAPTFSAARTPREQIYDEVIIPDAKRAAELLPVKEYKGQIGRSTKKAAKALLARVLLTRAQYEEEGSAAQMALYDSAYVAAMNMIENIEALNVKLYATYDDIWKARNNKNNTEFLWVTTFSENSALDPDSKPNRVFRYFAPRLNGNGGITSSSWEYPKEGGMVQPSYYFMTLWEDWDARYDAIFQEEFPAQKDFSWNFAAALRFNEQNILVGKKVKKDETVMRFTKDEVTEEMKKAVNYAYVGVNDIFDLTTKNSYGGARLFNIKDSEIVSQGHSEYAATAFPRFMKYRVWDPDMPDGPKLLADPAGQFGYGDVPVMRFAEVPLIAAECLIKLGRTGEAAEIINKHIRNARVVKAGHKLSEAQVTPSDMTIEWIMEERARELCGEWLRWFDCKRIYAKFDKNATNPGRGYKEDGTFSKIIRGRNPSMTSDDCLQEYHAQRPIPNTFLDKLQNANEFGQNKGYDPYVRQ